MTKTSTTPLVGLRPLEPGDLMRNEMPRSATSINRTGSIFLVGLALCCSACSWMPFASEDEKPPLGIDLEAGEEFQLESQFFATASSELSNDGKRYITAASDDLIESYQSGDYVGPLCIEGHTDSRGEADENLKLSERRASAVKQLLIDEGVENEIETVGKGETESSEAPSYNEARRVDVRLSACSEDPGPELADDKTIEPASGIDLSDAGQMPNNR